MQQKIFSKNPDNTYQLDDMRFSYLEFREDCDGAILEYSDQENLQKAKEKEQHIGVISKNRRHDIMLAAESEPAFIVINVWQDGLENNQELISWYNDFFLIQLCLKLNDTSLKPQDFNSELIISCC